MKLTLALAAVLALAGCKTPDTAGSDVKEGLASEEVQKLFKTTEGIQYALKSGLVTSQYAKEVCSCVFISKIDHATCIARSNMYVTELMVTAEIDLARKRVKGLGKPGPGSKDGINPPFEAEFRPDKPWLGCRIITPPREIPQ